jgi:hypothetical protein
MYKSEEEQRMKHVLLFVGAVVLSLAVAATAQSSPLVGTWKLNVDKSKYDPGPTPKELTRTIVADGKGVKYTFAGTSGDGKTISYGFSVQFDGKDNPINGTIPSGADSISAKRVDANHYVATLKKAGKVIGTSKVTVSADGKVTTVESTGTTADGKPEHDMQVYDKQ